MDLSHKNQEPNQLGNLQVDVKKINHFILLEGKIDYENCRGTTVVRKNV